jgi:putative hydrolase of the HAD superfamily
MFAGLSASAARLGILTDGRSTTQRNKIKALGLDLWISEVVISEEFGSHKPDPRNYQYFEKVFPGGEYIYVGDNLCKDFVAPNSMGWKTVVLLDRGKNIHKQRFGNLKPGCCPQYALEALV